MKLLVSAVALATLVALPAFAQVPRQNPNEVIFNSKVIGADPDPAVRFELRRDWGWQKGGAYK